jgi:glycosyltransferase involved in cell wall biosynthesis
MKIAFDAKRAAQNRTGLGNYSRFVLEGLCRAYTDDEYLLYTPSKRKSALLEPLRGYAQCRIVYPDTKLWQKLPSLWRVSAINKQIAADAPQIFHGLSNELPIGIERIEGLKTVVTIHDLIFLRYPEYYDAVSRRIYDYKFRRACRVADSVIAVSECTKRDIMKFYGTPEDKIRVIYQGCNDNFRRDVSQEKIDEARSKYALPEKFLLYVGSIEERKNLLLIVKALKLSKSKLKLVAVGKHTAYTDTVNEYIRREGLTDRVIMIHNAEYRLLPALYRMASVFIYPSRFEGFGIPILEALCSKVPVIGATGSCLEEAGGEGSIYVDPDDDKAMAEAIDRIEGDEALRLHMIEEGLKHADKFRREQLTAEMKQHYKELLNKK